MAYTTASLEGINTYAKTTANGKYYFGGTFETKKNRVAGNLLGSLKGEMNFEGSKIISVSDADFGTLYYLASKLYLVDDFGNRLELNSNNDWDVVGVIDIDTSSTDSADNVGYDNGWGDTTGTENNTTKKATVGGWLGGISDVLKGAGDLLKGSNGTTANNFDPEAEVLTKNNTLLYVIIAMVVIVIGVVVYLLTTKRKSVQADNIGMVQPLPNTLPLSGIYNPKRLR